MPRIDEVLVAMGQIQTPLLLVLTCLFYFEIICVEKVA